MRIDPHETLLKFGYPTTVTAEYEHWVVLVRPKQITLASLVLACREEATAFADVSAAAFAELGAVVADVEANLRRVAAYEKVNYLMLMMVDPHVHFHVVPRYAGTRRHDGVDYPDRTWPGPPDLAQTVELTAASFDALVAHLRDTWQRR